jgi:hypothetical protein
MPRFAGNWVGEYEILCDFANSMVSSGGANSKALPKNR